MRYTFGATLAALMLTVSLPMIGQGQSLSITNYQLVSSVQASATLWQLTYRADVANGLTPWGSVTATAATLNPTVLRIVPSQNTLTFPAVPANGQVTSTNTFAVLVTNPSVPLDTTKLTWTFQTTPQGPVANAGPDQTVPVGTKVTLSGSGSTNPSGTGSLTYYWTFTSRPPGTTTRLTSSWGVMSGFTVDVVGNYTLSLTVSNGVASSTAYVTISTFSSPPVANAGSNQFVNIGALVQLDGSGSTDVDGNLLSYHWTITAAPADSTATLSSPFAVNPTFTADLPGTYQAKLIVSDAQASSTPSTVTITTNPPTVPMAFAGQSRTVAHNTTITLEGVGVDPQGKPLVYTWTLLTQPAGSTTAISNTTIPQPTLFVDKPGVYVAQLIVSDGPDTSAASTVTITTTNTPPVANAGSNQTVLVGRTAFLTGAGSFDVDNDPLSYSWTFTHMPPGSSASLSGSNTEFPTFVPDIGGTYVVQLIVSDPYASCIVPSTVTITVPAPVVITLAPNPLALSSFAATLTVNLSASAGPNGAVVNLTSSNTAAATVPLTVSVLAGASTASVTVMPGTASGSTSITASGSNMTSGTATVNFTAVAITLTPNPMALGGTAGTMTVTLSAPAGPNGAVINLTSSSTTAATVPSTATVLAGATTTSFTVTPGSASGATTITAASPSMTSGTATVNYTRPPFLILPSNSVDVLVGATIPFPVSLSIPAPSPNGVVVTLVSSDTTKVKLGSASVTVPAGAVAPATQPTIKGVNIGASTITVSAPGFPTASQTADTVETVSFYPTSVSLPFISSNRYTWLTLSGNAPAGGLTFNLKSDNPAVATVPATVTIPAGATDVQVYVTGVSNGSTTIHASLLPFIPDTTATVKVGP